MLPVLIDQRHIPGAEKGRSLITVDLPRSKIREHEIENDILALAPTSPFLKRLAEGTEFLDSVPRETSFFDQNCFFLFTILFIFILF
jgi:hypothetical protein